MDQRQYGQAYELILNLRRAGALHPMFHPRHQILKNHMGTCQSSHAPFLWTFMSLWLGDWLGKLLENLTEGVVLLNVLIFSAAWWETDERRLKA
jgi:hypothetical protein